MKNTLKKMNAYGLAALLLILGATSCKKDLSSNNGGNVVATTSTSSTIAVATDSTSGSGTGSSSDSVYIIHPCAHGVHRDSIAAADLSATIQSYLSNNYSGYTFLKAFTVKDANSTVQGYVVIIRFNGKPVGLQFNADGSFVKVLEQRERGDIGDGPGWHRGGLFDCRDGQHRDTLSLTALPAAVTSYMAGTYAADTLVRAFSLKDGGFLVISKDSGLYATVFTSAGVFVKRVVIPSPVGLVIAVATLPDAALNYLSTTYPNYVLDKAFSITTGGTLRGYVAIINANNTRYCVAFDASGNFVASKAIW
ncbi:MAG TPA: hypothetical protein VG842_10050 [Sediminibacterium sp.]|nr:hypothetical protein [Sediminibacterium sp.]